MMRIADKGRGVLVLLHGAGDLLQGVASLDDLQATGNAKPVLRRYGIGAQILKKLGLHHIALLSNQPKTIVGLDGFGLSVKSFESF
jgi:3,4-dihydroxy 2-butanone 4-phosphate synthase/GTP cyclohydrolase II